MGFDPNQIFSVVRNGGPDVIFLLLLVLGLVLAGWLRPKASVESEMAALTKAHEAEMRARDAQVDELRRLQDRMNRTVERQQQLFEQSLSLIRADFLPLLRSALGSDR